MSRLLPILALLLAIGLFFGYIDPTFNGSIASLKKEIAGYESALKAAEEFEVKQAELASAKAAIPPESLARLEAFLPDGVDNVQLILDLDALASRSGMRLEDFDIAQSTPPPGDSGSSFALENQNPIDSIDLTMTGIGSYPAFRSFLAGMEQSLRPLDLVSLEVRSSETGVYQYSMTVRIYWLR